MSNRAYWLASFASLAVAVGAIALYFTLLPNSEVSDGWFYFTTWAAFVSASGTSGALLERYWQARERSFFEKGTVRVFAVVIPLVGLNPFFMMGVIGLGFLAFTVLSVVSTLILTAVWALRSEESRAA